MQTCTIIFSYTTVTKLHLIAVTVSHLQAVWKSVAGSHLPVPCSSDSKHEKYPHTHVRMVAGSCAFQHQSLFSSQFSIIRLLMISDAAFA